MRCVATAIDSNSPKVHRCENKPATSHIKPCTSSFLLHSCLVLYHVLRERLSSPPPPHPRPFSPACSPPSAFSSRERAHIQVGQCGNQETHVEILRRGRRAIRANAAMVILRQYRLSRYYLLSSAVHLPKRVAAGLRRVFLPQAQAAL
jgi:hypothetical protein